MKSMSESYFAESHCVSTILKCLYLFLSFFWKNIFTGYKITASNYFSFSLLMIPSYCLLVQQLSNCHYFASNLFAWHLLRFSLPVMFCSFSFSLFPSLLELLLHMLTFLTPSPRTLNISSIFFTFLSLCDIFWILFNIYLLVTSLSSAVSNLNFYFWLLYFLPLKVSFGPFSDQLWCLL